MQKPPDRGFGSILVAGAIFLSLARPDTPARAEWSAEAFGRAVLGADPNTMGSEGQLSIMLVTEVVPNEAGRVRAEIPEGSVLIVGDLTFNVQAGKTADGFLLIEFPQGLTFNADNLGSVRIAGGPANAPGPYRVAFPLRIPDANSFSAFASTAAFANGATDRDSDGPNAGSPASATSTSMASRGGTPISNPMRVGPSWGVFGDTRLSIDGGPLMNVYSYGLTRDAQGNVIADNVATDLPSGPLPPNTTFTASGEFMQSFSFGPGDHTVHFEHEVTAFLEDAIVPEPSSLALLGTGILGLLGYCGLQGGRNARRFMAELRRRIG